jgi:competence protein ComEC
MLFDVIPLTRRVKKITISVGFYLLFFSLGFYCFQRSIPPSLAVDKIERTRIFRVKEVLKQKEEAVQLALRLEKGNDSVEDLQGQVFWCHLRMDSTQISPKFGQLIWLKSKILTLPEVRNPGAFDFGAYLLQKGYSGQIFGSSASWDIVPAHKEKPSMIRKWRRYLLSEIESWQWAEENEAVFKALILGYKNDLAKELKADFAAAGAMHLLAVSGLHVGIIYLLLSYFLLAFAYFRKLQLLRSLILIGGIWLYALISGASPSVLRSATMFSIMAAVYNLERPGSSFRAIFLSAFVLLIFNAAWLFNLGFQLSYSALLGILIWQPKIEGLIKTRFKIVLWLNKLLSVSLAAQIGTLPLALYYFNQFPTYFWLSNILMIPLVTVLMYAGFILLLVGQAETLGFLYQALEQLLSLLIYINEKIATLPGALIKDIPFGSRQALLLGALVILFSVFLLHKRKMALYGAVALVFLFGVNQMVGRYLRINSAEVLIYEERSFTASWRKGEEFYVYASDSSQYENFGQYLWRDHMLVEGLDPGAMRFFGKE